jgi:hypothetical protein
MERNRQELQYLKRKWGDAIAFKRTDTTLRIVVRVKREVTQKG